MFERPSTLATMATLRGRRASFSLLLFFLFLLLTNISINEAKRSLFGNRKSSSYTTRKPATAYHPNEQTKLSYSPNYSGHPSSSSNQNSNPSYGWNSNTQSHPAPPPNYAQATNSHSSVSHSAPFGSGTNNYHQPQSGSLPQGATYHQPGQLPPGAVYHNAPPPASATYHQPGQLPPGSTYYNSPPPGAIYHQSGHVPMGGYSNPASQYPHQTAYGPGGGALPAGATYFSAGSSLPPGATLYSAPPQQSSSGLGFGSGLAAGAIGGAVLGHVLTPTHTKVIEQSSSSGSSDGGSGGDRIIIINNGQPLNASDFNGTTTVINAASGQPAQPLDSNNAAATTNTPLAPMTGEMGANASNTETSPGSGPAPGGIICVPTRINETDPNDSTKMIEVEKIACYPAPPPQAQIQPTVPPSAAPGAISDVNQPSSLTSNQPNSNPIPVATNEKLSDGAVPLRSGSMAQGISTHWLLLATIGLSSWLMVASERII